MTIFAHATAKFNFCQYFRLYGNPQAVVTLKGLSLYNARLRLRTLLMVIICASSHLVSSPHSPQCHLYKPEVSLQVKIIVSDSYKLICTLPMHSHSTCILCAQLHSSPHCLHVLCYRNHKVVCCFRIIYHAS